MSLTMVSIELSTAPETVGLVEVDVDGTTFVVAVVVVLAVVVDPGEADVVVLSEATRVRFRAVLLGLTAVGATPCELVDGALVETSAVGSPDSPFDAEAELDALPSSFSANPQATRPLTSTARTDMRKLRDAEWCAEQFEAMRA